MNRIWRASYARGSRLAKTGCPLPYLNALPGRERFHQRKLYVCQLGGYIESYAIDWGTSTGYAIALRVGTDLSCGAVITDYWLELPWPDHHIDWAYHPENVLPKSRLHEYAELVESKLPDVLNERRLLSREHPVEGLLCGYAWTPIPASCLRDRPATAQIVLVDDSGRRVRAPIQLTTYRPPQQKGRMRESEQTARIPA
jgi:hypothetical protein